MKRAGWQNSETLSGGVALLVGAGFLLETFDSSYAALGRGTTYGPMFFPRLLLGFWLVLACALAVRGLLGRPAGGGETAPRGPFLVRTCLTVVIVSAGAWLMAAIGFIPAMFLTTVGVAIVLGWRRPVILLATAITWPVLVWYVFTAVLKFSLPATTWFRGL